MNELIDFSNLSDFNRTRCNKIHIFQRSTSIKNNLSKIEKKINLNNMYLFIFIFS